MNIFQTKDKYPSIKTIGIGLTNKCNLNCEHCYSRKMVEKEFDIKDANKILTTFPNLEFINFGTGESILNKQFKNIINLFYSKGIKMAITSNSLSINKMEENLLSKFEDVDISLDFPKAKLHDKWRCHPGLFKDVLNAIKKCKKFKINVSIVSVLMANNFNYFPGFKKILDKYNINLRINIYKPVNKDQFTPTYDQFWSAIKDISENFEVVSCSEPILALVWKNISNGSKCGNSIRIHPDGELSSCVYIKNGESNKKFNHDKKILPSLCKKCDFSDRCMGGCYGRRIAENRKNFPDLYCPFLYGKKKPTIRFKKHKQSKDLIHSNYLCTIILR
jgi:radical SAM protein with 4Fe4S-binding SPASM domain